MVERGGWPAGWYPDPTGRAPRRWWDGTAWTAGVGDDQGRTWTDPGWVPQDGSAGLGAPAPSNVPPPAPSRTGWRRAYGTGWVVLSLILCFPIGLLLVWTHPTWKREHRWIATGLVAVLVIATAVSGGGQEPEQVATAPPPTTAPLTLPTEHIRPTTTTTTTPPTTSTSTTTTAPPTTTLPPTTAPPTTAAPPPPPTAPPTIVEPQTLGGGCHPSYTPCVPITSDVDCAGGSGNGPAYTGRVTVIGPDEYDLDRDGDGIGCEDG